MKKIYILALAAAFGATSVFAQSNRRIQTPQNATHSTAEMNKKFRTGFENIQDSKADVPPSAFARGFAKALGVTNYDLQTNGSMKPRILNLGAGKIAASYTYATGDIGKDGMPNRGTGYNTNVSGAFLPQPVKRTESIRTGFTNLCMDVDGTEYSFAHTALNPVGYQIVMNKKTKGATTWKQSNVPIVNAKAGLGAIWPYVAIGGANGKTIHMVALNDTDTMYNKMSGPAMLYTRSKDGGATWDKIGFALPGVDKDNYLEMSGDSYAIASKGNTVAVAYFGNWEDTNVWISQDNGDTWTKKTVYKFPLPLYKTDGGYDITKFPATDESAEGHILTTDNSGAVFIDNNGKVHVVAGRTFVFDLDLTDGVKRFNQNVNGFIHWDETLPKDSLQFVEAWADKVADNQVTLQTGAFFGTYFHSATCWPSVAVAADGTLYMVYSAPDETRFDGANDLYRSIFVIKSKDNGKTWTKPYDIIDNKKYYDNKTADIESDYAECTFPSIAALIDNNKLHITYQVDDTEQLHLQFYDDTTNPITPTENYINYVDVDIADIVATEEVAESNEFKFTVNPNPVSNFVSISYELIKSTNVKISISDFTGRKIISSNFETQNAGQQFYSTNIDLVVGMYLVTLNIDNKISTQKLIVK